LCYRLISKLVERRALFLSKIQAPPSPSAINMPKTPPESPAIFHYSFPSPGLESPLAVFEQMVTEDPTRPPRQTWVEQVEFRMPEQKVPSVIRSVPVRKGRLPSLAQITAHYTPIGGAAASLVNTAPARRALPAAVGRLHFPVRSSSPPAAEESAKDIVTLAPRPPMSPSSPKLKITTLVVPCTSSHSPIEFSESNLRAFDAMRAGTAQVMMSRLRRRTMSPASARLSPANLRCDDEEKKMRRRSAPPELPLRERRGFTKPPLNLPGAF
jgi:hypothetical protein